MSEDNDTPKRYVAPATDPYGHLLIRDTRSQGERDTADRKEAKRRKGTGRGGHQGPRWWLDVPDNDDVFDA